MAEIEFEEVPSSGIPSGAILMWSGLIAKIPTGWVICDGNNGTPDLRARFIRGAPAGIEAGTTGGEDTHILTVAEMPAHSHTINITAAPPGAANLPTGAGNTNPVQQTTSSTGSSNAHENRPAYFELIYIMKT